MAQTGKITDLNNLKFFSDSGIEIYMEKQYVITWHLSYVDTKYCMNQPEGFVMADVKYNEEYQTYVIDPDTIHIGFSTCPEIALTEDINIKDPVKVSKYIKDVLCCRKEEPVTKKKKYKAKKNIEPVVVLAIEVQGQKFSTEVSVGAFFGHLFTYSTKKIAYGENDDTDENFIKILVVESCDPYYDGPEPYLYKLFCGLIPVEQKDRLYYFHHAFNKMRIPQDSDIIVKGEPLPNLSEADTQYLTYEEKRYLALLSSGLAQYFPFVRYSGSLMQSKTSTGFIAANTILVLEEVSKSR